MNDLLLFGYVSVSTKPYTYRRQRYLSINWKLALRRDIGAEGTDLGITCRGVIAETEEIDETMEKESQREENKDRAWTRHSFKRTFLSTLL